MKGNVPARFVRVAAALVSCFPLLLLAAQPPKQPDLFQRAWPATSRPHRRVVLSSKVTELVHAIDVEEGGRVNRGQVVVRLDDRVLAAQAAVAEKSADFDSRILAAEKRWRHQQRELKRRQDLGEFISGSALDAAQIEVDLAELDLRELERQRDLAQRNYAFYQARLMDYAIVSPIDGVVSNLFVEQGEMVNEAQEIAEIIDQDTIEVRVHLPERNLTQMKDAGQVRVLFPAFSAERFFPARLHFISPYVDSSSGTFLVKVLVDAKEQDLMPGLGCEVRFDEADAAPEPQ